MKAVWIDRDGAGHACTVLSTDRVGDETYYWIALDDFTNPTRVGGVTLNELVIF